MHYAYILVSTKNPTKLYIGTAVDLDRRLQEHNRAKSTYSSRYAPWQLRTYVAFSNKKCAEEFEKYLKSGSGFAFMKKRLL